MKRKSFIGVVALGAFLVIFAGIAQAGGGMHKSSGDERGAMKTTSQGFSFAETGEGGPTLEYWEALETGSISSPGGKSRLVDTGVDPSRWEGPTQ